MQQSSHLHLLRASSVAAYSFQQIYNGIGVFSKYYSHSKGSDSLVSLMSMPMCLLYSYTCTFSKLSKHIPLIHIC